MRLNLVGKPREHHDLMQGCTRVQTPYCYGVTRDELVQFSALAALCLVVLLFTLRAARRQRLTFRFTTGWLMLCVMGIAAGALIPLVSPIAGALRVTPGVVVLTAATAVLLAIAMQLSVSTSGSHRQSEILAIKLAHVSVIEARPIDPKELVIVPAWNEADTIGRVVAEIQSSGYAPVVVDDGSRDRTAQCAAEAGATVLSLPFNLGVGAAIRCGLQYAVTCGVHRVVQCDGDGQHPVSHIEELLRAADAGADLVIGSRFASGEPPVMSISKARRTAMRFLAARASRAARTPLTDTTSGFRVITGDLLPQLATQMPSYYLGDTYEVLLAAGRAGYRIKEVPVPIGEREAGSPSSGIRASILMVVKAVVVTSLRVGIALSPPPRTAP